MGVFAMGRGASSVPKGTIVQVPGKSVREVQNQEIAPDAAGLEPSAEGSASIARPINGDGRPGGGGGAARPSKRKSWVDHPASVSVIMSLALPTLVEQVLSAVIGFTDTVVAGHTGVDGPDRAAAAAAVGAMTYLQWFAGLMTATLGVGATAIVARSIGAGKPRMANRVAGTACVTAFAIGILVAVLFFFGAPVLAWAFRFDGRTAEYATEYLRIMCWTVCFQTAGQIGMACLRGAGDTKRPLVVTAVITVVNGIFSWALTFGKLGMPAWGVRGNATGTLLAFMVAGIVTFGFLLYGDGGLQLRLRHLKIVPHLLRRIGRIGIPSFLEGMLLWGGQLTVVMLVMGAVDKAVGEPGSGITMAAHNAAIRIEGLAFLPGYGFGIACSALVGQFLGAKKPFEAQRVTVLCNRLAVIMMTLAALPMVFFPRVMIGLLVDSDDVVKMGWIPLVLAGLAQPGFAVAIIKSSALKGAGDTMSPMYTTLIGMGSRVVAVIVIMMVLSNMGRADLGLICVWVCIFLDLGFRGLAMEMVFRRGKWKEQKV
jgi:putative MATE family efflux protein